MKVNEIPALSIGACRVSQMRRLSESINWEVRGARPSLTSRYCHPERSGSGVEGSFCVKQGERL